ncbi:MAG TPA: beta-propeller domain-containing protein [Thermoplasmata archaeon]|jgi:uncharacterized secreted protein with C-terminal beta-propeller domain
MNPETKVFGALLLGVSLTLLCVTAYTVRISEDSAADGILPRFTDKAQLAEFLAREASFPDGGQYSFAPDEMSASREDTSAGVPYSQTNVQVLGVDEYDFVKTNGEHIFVSSGQEVSIIDAYPAQDMEKVSSISASDIVAGAENTSAYVSGLFVSGVRLVVIANIYSNSDWLYRDAYIAEGTLVDQTRTMVAVFDVSDPANPQLDFSVGISGYDLTCRMVDDTVYVITQTYIRNMGAEVMIPFTYSDAQRSEVDITTIRYDPETPEATAFVNVLAVDLNDGDHESLSVLAGWASTIYMSSDSLYITIQKWTGSVISFEDELAPEDPDRTVTSIYRVDLAGTHMSPAAAGDVSGWLLNQFSMDEHESYLRVATTTGWMTPKNAVYVLDHDLDLVGALESLAPDERIYSARFVENKLYLVTFRQMDPLFVIDLSDPSEPEVVGMLEIPGFSTYIHPIDDTHMLGIGQENWTVKLSLFDVSDPANPIEQSKYLLEDVYWSAALYDHKAVLYDAEKELLVIPGYSQIYDGLYRYYTVPSAYVFTVSASEGISLRGIVTHELEGDWGASYIERTMYIGEYLYTVSRSAVQANMLDDLGYVKMVRFSDDTYNVYYGD